MLNFTLDGFRERLDVSVSADQWVSAYIMDGENYENYQYCMLSWNCPPPYPVVWFEYESVGSLQVTQTRWQATTQVESGYHLLLVGPDFTSVHMTLTIVQFTW